LSAEHCAHFFKDVGAPNVAGLVPALNTLASKVDVATDAIFLSINDLGTLLQSWLVDGRLFSAAALDPIIDILVRHIDAFIKFVKDVVSAAADALHAAWANPNGMLDWLDQTLPVPFLRGFYKGLTGNNFSIFDVVCLAAAIPASIIGGGPSVRVPIVSAAAMGATVPKPPTTQQKAGAAAQWFMVAGCFTTGLSAGVALGLPASDARTDILGAIDKCMTIAAVLCTTVEGDELWEEIVVPTLIGVGGGVLGAMKYFGKPISTITDPALVLRFAVSIVQLARGAKRGDANTIAYQSISAAQVLISLSARYATQRGKKPQPAWAIQYGVLQGALSLVKTGFYVARPQKARS
jgi:hypothetical protein